jgi:hypothetical protein
LPFKCNLQRYIEGVAGEPSPSGAKEVAVPCKAAQSVPLMVGGYTSC